MPGISDDVQDVANNIIAKLPAGFVLLLAIVLGAQTMSTLLVYWFMHDQSIARIEAVTKIFQACTVALTKG
jgi:hypothetical protein